MFHNMHFSFKFKNLLYLFKHFSKVKLSVKLDIDIFLDNKPKFLSRNLVIANEGVLFINK